jgi:uncharacterized protein YkwD
MLRIAAVSALLVAFAAGFPELFFPALTAPFGNAPSSAAKASFTAMPAEAEAGFDENAERELAGLINQERIRRGLPALATDERLVQAARAHTQEMAARNNLSHQFSGEPDLRHRIAQSKLRIKRVAENVGYGSNIELTHRGFMESPKHRENILYPDYNAVGVGALRSGDVLYVTEDFAQRLPEVSSEQVEEEVAAAFQEMRRGAGSPGLVRARNGRLRELACSMARNDRLETYPALKLPGVRFVSAFTQMEPQQLPTDAKQASADATLQRFAVGACFERTANYPNGTYWVLMAFY